MFNIAVAQSGGPTAAINSSLAGVFAGAAECSEIDCIYGSINGIEGIINDNIIDLRNFFVVRAVVGIIFQLISAGAEDR